MNKKIDFGQLAAKTTYFLFVAVLTVVGFVLKAVLAFIFGAAQGTAEDMGRTPDALDVNDPTHDLYWGDNGKFNK